MQVFVLDWALSKRHHRMAGQTIGKVTITSCGCSLHFSEKSAEQFIHDHWRSYGENNPKLNTPDQYEKPSHDGPISKENVSKRYLCDVLRLDREELLVAALQEKSFRLRNYREYDF